MSSIGCTNYRLMESKDFLSVTLPNSRQVRWRFAQVAKTFGILQHGVDPKINLAALVRKYRGTIVLEEVLNKLYHERMDIQGAKDVLRGIQSRSFNVVANTFRTSRSFRPKPARPVASKLGQRGCSCTPPFAVDERTCRIVLSQMQSNPAISRRAVP